MCSLRRCVLLLGILQVKMWFYPSNIWRNDRKSGFIPLATVASSKHFLYLWIKPVQHPGELWIIRVLTGSLQKADFVCLESFCSSFTSSSLPYYIFRVVVLLHHHTLLGFCLQTATIPKCMKTGSYQDHPAEAQDRYFTQDLCVGSSAPVWDEDMAY